MTRFDRSKRLLTPHQFKRVFQKSRRFQDELLTLRVRYHDGSTARLGLAIAKKHARLAVQRNRIKRHVREAFRLAHTDLAVGDYVILNRPVAARATAKALRQSAAALFEAAGRRKTHQ
ncbi:MAG: ribonuclease P protein component [Pseudomonadota bacterium]